MGDCVYIVEDRSKHSSWYPRNHEAYRSAGDAHRAKDTLSESRVTRWFRVRKYVPAAGKGTLADEIETLRLVNAALHRRLSLVHDALHKDVEFLHTEGAGDG